MQIDLNKLPEYMVIDRGMFLDTLILMQNLKILMPFILPNVPPNILPEVPKVLALIDAWIRHMDDHVAVMARQEAEELFKGIGIDLKDEKENDA